jgi:cell division ATPase FtsA
VLCLIGLSHQSSKGIEGGTIIDLKALEYAILNAVHLAEQMAGEDFWLCRKNLIDGIYLT